MASGYALPGAGGSQHAHSHSFSGLELSPGKPARSGFLHSNGHHVRNAVSHSSLYPHAERSRETSPLPSPQPGHVSAWSPDLHQDHPSTHTSRYSSPTRHHNHSHSHSPMKGRPRGESDLGRPADPKSTIYNPTLESISAAPTSWFSLPEALTALLIPLPYLLTSVAYSSTTTPLNFEFPPLAAYGRPLSSAMTGDAPISRSWRPSGYLEACMLTSATLILLGGYSKMRAVGRVLDRRKEAARSPAFSDTLKRLSSWRTMTVRALGLGLPLYASTLIGGMRVGLVLLVAIAANLACADHRTIATSPSWKQLLSSRVATGAVIVLSFICDLIGVTLDVPLTSVIFGYIPLTLSVSILQPPLPSLGGASLSRPTSMDGSTVKTSSWSRAAVLSLKSSATSPFAASVEDANLTLLSGVSMAGAVALWLILDPLALTLSWEALMAGILASTTLALATYSSQPSTLRSENRAGLALGCVTTTLCAFMFSPSLWPGTVVNGGLSALAFVAVLYDTQATFHVSHSHAATTSRNDDQEHHHHHCHDHVHTHSPSERGPSGLTKLIMAQCEPGSLVHGILGQKDSRRIAYFTLLNFAFMLVQGAYGYLSGSLGLLSDTVHMFFDCLGLVVGLGAAVASKWPTSPEKPYGWGKLNTLAGFGNGIFLMLVSVEFVWEAIEGILEGRELRHVQELLVVSTLGFLVNMVGLLAFGHAHAGHDHGHSHPHSDHHDHGHSHENGHAHHHDHDPKPTSSNHAHDHHHNENMHGIFLHVAADAGGSLAVIISTALTLWRPWYLWDPLATIIIAILIFAAAVPLVVSSGQKLLLVIPDDLEYKIKSTLQELGELRGVIGYASPRFWIDDKEVGDDGHAHHHDSGDHDHKPHSHEHGPQKSVNDHHHDSHDHVHGHGGDDAGQQKVLGVVHVIIAPMADYEDVRQRVESLFTERNMNVVIHIEREAEDRH